MRLGWFDINNLGILIMPRQRLLSSLTIGAAVLLVALSYIVSDAQKQPDMLQQQIAQVEHQVDVIEAEAIAALPSIATGGSHEPVGLGEILFFDKTFSVN